MTELTFLKILISIRQVNQKECVISHYWYFLDGGFKFCHDVLIMSMNLSGIIVLNIHGVDYHCTINKILNGETISLTQNADLNKKVGKL